ncbi:signal-regulatory protein beta-2-like [Epinephelus lanceolatus]
MKMVIIFYLLLVLNIGRCTVNQIFETKTVGVGADVTLTCPRKSSGSIFWIRLVSGDIPKVLAKTYSFESDPRITATEERGQFVLHIKNVRRSDTAVYLCVKKFKQDFTLLKGADLRVEGPEPDITAVIQDPSDPVRPGDSVTLQCSVLSDSEKKSCPGNHSVFWFRAASDEFHPSAIYAYGNSAECEKSPEAHSPQKCVYSFSKDVSSSDAGTYYCAVATCGEILFGNGTKLDIEDISRCDSQNTVLFLVCAALALSLIVIAVLVHAIRTKSCDCFNAAATLQTNAATASCDQQSQQRNAESLVYCTPNFTRRKAGRGGRRNQRQEETIYTDVRAFMIYD